MIQSFGLWEGGRLSRESNDSFARSAASPAPLLSLICCVQCKEGPTSRAGRDREQFATAILAQLSFHPWWEYMCATFMGKECSKQGVRGMINGYWYFAYH